jgi:ketosteroid isomerase-like protein
MSHENVEIVQRSCEAFDRGDYEEAMSALDPEIEYDLSHFPEGRVYHGHDGVREAFRTWLGAFDDYRQEREIIDAGDDEVVVVVHEYGRGKTSGAEVVRITHGLWFMRKGKAVRIEFHPSREAALEAAGRRD